MKKIPIVHLLAAVLFLSQCRTVKTGNSTTGGNLLTASITSEGFIECFEKGLVGGSQPVCCEASAILYDGSKLLLANDKEMPDGRSSVFYWPMKNGFADTLQPATYLINPVFKSAKKIEDFASTPDGSLVFLSTAFDRIKPGTSEWNPFNTILYWQKGQEAYPSILRLHPTDSSSVFLREKFSTALSSADFPGGMPYFKIEGIAATADRLYFGIREEGKKFDDFAYKVKILTVSFQYNNGTVTLGDTLKLLCDIHLSATDTALLQPQGISSIEYDHFNKRFLILTSYENKEKLGGYLWSATLDDLASNHMFPVRDPKGLQIHFTHKSEDIAIISSKKAIVIHDDDRILTTINGKTRQQNQAAFSIVEFK